MTEAELTANLFKLADMGITGLEANYDVSEGTTNLSSIFYTTGVVPETKRPLFVAAVRMLDADMNELFREYIIDNIIKTHFDGFNQPDGCSGDIYMWVPSGKYELLHRKRVITYKIAHYNGDLINNTLKIED